MRSPSPALSAATLALLAASPARAEPPGTTLTGWPCKDCLTYAPPTGIAPRPLLVALHGDDGGAAKLFRALRPACEQAQVILVSLRCPTDLGCKTSFWQWSSMKTHDAGWLRGQMLAVGERFPVDPARVYAAGYSGGATYLGWYGPTFPGDFAAIAHIAGGMPWGTRCPDCKVPVYFTLGTTDPMLVPYTRPLRDYYQACGGHEIVWQTLPGVTHESVIPTVQAGKGKEILAWLLAHRATCGDASAARDAGPDATTPIEPDASAIVEASPPDAAAPIAAAPAPGEAPPPLKAPPRPSSCACGIPARGSGGGLLAWLGLLALVATRRSRRP